MAERKAEKARVLSYHIIFLTKSTYASSSFAITYPPSWKHVASRTRTEILEERKGIYIEFRGKILQASWHVRCLSFAISRIVVSPRRKIVSSSCSSRKRVINSSLTTFKKCDLKSQWRMIIVVTTFERKVKDFFHLNILKNFK